MVKYSSVARTQEATKAHPVVPRHQALVNSDGNSTLETKVTNEVALGSGSNKVIGRNASGMPWKKSSSRASFKKPNNAKSFEKRMIEAQQKKGMLEKER